VWSQTPCIYKMEHLKYYKLFFESMRRIKKMFRQKFCEFEGDILEDILR